MKKEESIELQNKVISRMELIINDIKRIQKDMIDFDDTIINKNELKLKDDESILGVYKWMPDDRRIEILSMKDLDLFTNSFIIKDNKLSTDYYSDYKPLESIESPIETEEDKQIKEFLINIGVKSFSVLSECRKPGEDPDEDRFKPRVIIKFDDDTEETFKLEKEEVKHYVDSELDWKYLLSRSNRFQEQILKKWSPVLDALKVTVKRQFIAEYAEQQSTKENELLNSNPSVGVLQNLLPISLKILSKLNLNSKNVSLKDGLPTISFSAELEKNELENIKAADGLELVQKLENKIVDNLVTYINKELETKDNLYINTVCQSISLIQSEDWTLIMRITSSIQID